MITLVFLIVVFLAIGIIAITGVTAGVWLLPFAIIGYFVIKVLDKILKILLKRNDDVVVLNKKDFEQNYVRKSNK